MYSIMLDFTCKEYVSSLGVYEGDVKIEWEEMPNSVLEFEAPITRMILIEAHNRSDKTWQRFQRDWKTFPWWWFDHEIEEKDFILFDSNLDGKDRKLAGYRLTVVKEKNLNVIIYQKATLLFWGRHYLDREKVELQKSGREKQLIPYFDYKRKGIPTGRELEPWQYIHQWSGQKERRRARISVAQDSGEMLANMVSQHFSNPIFSSNYLEIPFFDFDFLGDISKTYFKIVKFKKEPKAGWWKCLNKGNCYIAVEYLSDFKNRP